MKTFSIVCIVLLMSVKAFAQQQPEDRSFYVAKMEHYKRMKSTGTTLTMLGSALVVIGYVTLLNSSVDEYNNGYTTTTTTHGNPGAGTACVLIGSACVHAGIPLWIVGGISKGRYERKIDTLSLKINMNRQSAGIALCYKF
jgi:hypothetical protein